MVGKASFFFVCCCPSRLLGFGIPGRGRGRSLQRLLRCRPATVRHRVTWLPGDEVFMLVPGVAFEGPLTMGFELLSLVAFLATIGFCETLLGGESCFCCVAMLVSYRGYAWS